MRLLLDTHVLLWWLTGDAALSRRAQTLIADDVNVIFVSAVSSWEIATKYRLGRLPTAHELAGDVSGALAQQEFMELPITIRHGQVAGSFAVLHRDPFDRMLAAQAIHEDLMLVSRDAAFDAFPIKRIW